MITKIVQRVFYISVAGVPADKLVAHIDEVKKSLLGSTEEMKTKVEDSSCGSVLWEDLFIPVKYSDSRVEFMQINIPQ